MDTPKGLIILLHNGFTKIAISEVLAALPHEWHGIHREVKEVNYSELLELQKLYDTGYEQYALEHRRYFANEILPELNAHPEYKVIYFGMAPIPLCVDFGHLFHNYRDIDIYQRHHVSKKWYINLAADQQVENKLEITGLPDQQQKGISDALIRVNISHNINPDDTYEILPNAAEIEIQFEHAGEDVITSSQKMLEVGESIKKAFDELSNNRSGIETVHFFASIPCGVAFLAGTKISPTIHSYIQTYQYSRTKEPRYKKALLIKAQLRPERKIGKKEKKRADKLRTLCNDELTKNVKQYCLHNRDMSVGRKWYEGLVPGVNNSIMNTKFWTDLPALHETSLKDDSFDFDTEVVNDGFYWRMNQWFVDNNFFISLNNRLSNPEDILKAVRLFLFHEAVHYRKHRLTGLTSVKYWQFSQGFGNDRLPGGCLCDNE